ncbi:DDE-type integrase/transposase/recombinase [Streptomyces sp. NPDC004059]
MKAIVIHEGLVSEYGFTGKPQRVKLYVQEARRRVAEELGITPKELAGMHRRFEVVPGAPDQVDWGDEGKILGHMGIEKVYSFHMTLSYSRDPFCCFTISQDLQTFFDCHCRAFAHFGGVPMTIVYDRTKTVVRRHVAPGEAVPLHPEAVAFAGHYDFDIDVLAAYRPTGKGRVEPQVLIVATTSWPAGPSPRSRRWTPPLWPGCHTGGPAHTQPITRSLDTGQPGTTRPSNHCRPPLTWWPNDTFGWSARTAWSPSPATSSRCLPAGSARQLVEVRATKPQVALHSTIWVTSLTLAAVVMTLNGVLFPSQI